MYINLIAEEACLALSVMEVLWVLLLYDACLYITKQYADFVTLGVEVLQDTGSTHRRSASFHRQVWRYCCKCCFHVDFMSLCWWRTIYMLFRLASNPCWSWWRSLVSSDIAGLIKIDMDMENWIGLGPECYWRGHYGILCRSSAAIHSLYFLSSL